MQFGANDAISPNEHRQSMFESKNKKIMYTQKIPLLQLTIQKWGVRGSKFHGHVGMMNMFIFVLAVCKGYTFVWLLQA